MKKKFLLDTNVLIRSPRSIYVFEDNDIFICNTTLEELDDLKTRPGETGYNAREVIRTLNKLREDNKKLNDGILLPSGGTLKVVPDCVNSDTEQESPKSIPDSWSLSKPDNRIIDTAIKNNAILVTSDMSMLIKAESAGAKTEIFRNEQVSDESMQYTGRHVVYADTETISEINTYGSVPFSRLYNPDNEKLEMNEFLIVTDTSNPSHTILAYFDGYEICKLYFDNSSPYGINPRNVGQRFALEALMTPANQVPLCILKGPAGVAKTFLSLAAGLDQVINKGLYRKVLILRPNIKFDDDIGYLKGTEMDKILPLIRPCIDNIEVLLSNKKESKRNSKVHDSTKVVLPSDVINNSVDELFSKGYVAAEAMAYLRGRSISNTFCVIDEAQNATPAQMLGIITRAGIGSKFVIIGDPDQIDNPKVDKKNNGLVFASEMMRGSNLCMQLTFNSNECTRSPLAMEASQLLNKRY